MEPWVPIMKNECECLIADKVGHGGHFAEQFVKR